MKIVIITSGGMDSTVLLHKHVKQGDQVRALAINYGQRHVCELEFAEYQAQLLRVPFMCADLRSLKDLLPGSSQTDPSVKVPEGHYTEESMKATVVPNRNMILLSVAIGHAIAHDMDYVGYAAHAGDHAIYPDCRPAFTSAMNDVAKLCDWKQVSLAPSFVHLTKAQIVSLGRELGVDFRMTYSCYAGDRNVHCGVCGTCVERREAFQLAGVKDFTCYAPGAPSLEEMLARVPGR